MNVQNNYKFNIIKALEWEKEFEKKRKCERTLLYTCCLCGVWDA